VWDTFQKTAVWAHANYRRSKAEKVPSQHGSFINDGDFGQISGHHLIMFGQLEMRNLPF
jgi:hypothetical protein